MGFILYLLYDVFNHIAHSNSPAPGLPAPGPGRLSVACSGCSACACSLPTVGAGLRLIVRFCLQCRQALRPVRLCAPVDRTCQAPLSTQILCDVCSFIYWSNLCQNVIKKSHVPPSPQVACLHFCSGFKQMKRLRSPGLEVSRGQQARGFRSPVALNAPARRALGQASAETHSTPSPSPVCTHEGGTFLPTSQNVWHTTVSQRNRKSTV